MHTVNIHEAKTHLPKLLEKVSEVHSHSSRFAEIYEKIEQISQWN